MPVWPKTRAYGGWYPNGRSEYGTFNPWPATESVQVCRSQITPNSELHTSRFSPVFFWIGGLFVNLTFRRCHNVYLPPFFLRYVLSRLWMIHASPTPCSTLKTGSSTGSFLDVEAGVRGVSRIEWFYWTSCTPKAPPKTSNTETLRHTFDEQLNEKEDR